MSHSHVCSIYHIVFATKQRTQTIPLAIQTRLWSYLAGIARNHGIRSLAIGGTENHVHMLVMLPANMAVGDAVRALKANSSRMMRESSRLFTWQEGYGAFSVSPSSVEGVKRYIDHQAEHHSKRSFDDELAAMLDAARGVAPEGARDR